MNKLLAALVIVIGLLLSAGCSPNVEEAQVDFCRALDGYRAATASLQEINAQTTVDELSQMRKDVEEARRDLLDSATVLREARLRYAEGAWEDLQIELSDVPGDTTLGEASPAIRGRVAVLLTEIDRANNVSCNRH